MHILGAVGGIFRGGMDDFWRRDAKSCVYWVLLVLLRITHEAILARKPTFFYSTIW